MFFNLPAAWKEKNDFFMFWKLMSVFSFLVFTSIYLQSSWISPINQYEGEICPYKPTYGPPGLITLVLRLRDSSSAWVILSRVIW